MQTNLLQTCRNITAPYTDAIQLACTMFQLDMAKENEIQNWQSIFLFFEELCISFQFSSLMLNKYL